MPSGETSSVEYSPRRLDTSMFWKNAVASSPISRRAVMYVRSVYILLVFSL